MSIKKYLKALEEIDYNVTNSGIFAAYDENQAENIWAIQVAYDAEKAGIPNKLIDIYVNGTLSILNGKAYDVETGKEIKFQEIKQI